VTAADVDEIAKLCADLVVAGFIEPTTWHEVPKPSSVRYE